jgi:hypothetical protein
MWREEHGVTVEATDEGEARIRASHRRDADGDPTLWRTHEVFIDLPAETLKYVKPTPTLPTRKDAKDE